MVEFVAEISHHGPVAAPSHSPRFNIRDLVYSVDGSAKGVLTFEVWTATAVALEDIFRVVLFNGWLVFPRHR